MHAYSPAARTEAYMHTLVSVYAGGGARVYAIQQFRLDAVAHGPIQAPLTPRASKLKKHQICALYFV